MATWSPPAAGPSVGQTSTQRYLSVPSPRRMRPSLATSSWVATWSHLGSWTEPGGSRARGARRQSGRARCGGAAPPVDVDGPAGRGRDELQRADALREAEVEDDPDQRVAAVEGRRPGRRLV